MTVRRYRTQLAPAARTGRPPDGADGGHARAGGLAVELVSLSQPAALAGQPQSTAGIGFADFVEAWLRTIRRNTQGSDGSRASCRMETARAASIICSATTGWRMPWIS
jgi:hypothetical protein